MTDIMTVSIIIISSEIVAIGVYHLIGKWNQRKERKNEINLNSIIKGVMERSFLTFALIIKIPEALTVFAALKIATRIKDDHKISNDFYLIGNILSITQAILYFKLICHYYCI